MKMKAIEKFINSMSYRANEYSDFLDSIDQKKISLRDLRIFADSLLSFMSVLALHLAKDKEEEELIKSKMERASIESIEDTLKLLEFYTNTLNVEELRPLYRGILFNILPILAAVVEKSDIKKEDLKHTIDDLNKELKTKEYITLVDSIQYKPKENIFISHVSQLMGIKGDFKLIDSFKKGTLRIGNATGSDFNFEEVDEESIRNTVKKIGIAYLTEDKNKIMQHIKEEIPMKFSPPLKIKVVEGENMGKFYKEVLEKRARN